MDPELVKVDTQLFKLLKGFELLAFVNPQNTSTEFKRFVKNKYIVAPKFKYAPIKVHPFTLKQQLSGIRVQDISDVSVRTMYESIVNSYHDKVDLLGSLNS